MRNADVGGGNDGTNDASEPEWIETGFEMQLRHV